ncbi:MAG: helix-turn-helix domain-containing protein [Eubacteriales bacterium]
MKNRVRELRRSNGVTQAELSRVIGVAQNTLSYWEQGKYDIDTDSLQRIADYFHCSVDYLLARSDHAAENKKEVFYDLFNSLSPEDQNDMIRIMLEKKNNK